MHGMNRKLLLIAMPLVFAATAAVITLPDRATSAAPETTETTGGITVQGTGTVTSVPDQAQLSFGVESQGDTAKAALAANAAEMRRMLAALKAAGAKDVKTQYVSVSPRYGDEMSVLGYTATNSVSATVDQIANAGAVIDAAVAAGANQISGPSLSRADQDDLYKEALEAAVDDARERAETLAAAANVSLGDVKAIVEGGGMSPPMPYAADAALRAESTPIEAGKHEVSASVTITFSIS
jgi:uncharacterized protein YggE